MGGTGGGGNDWRGRGDDIGLESKDEGFERRKRREEWWWSRKNGEEVKDEEGKVWESEKGGGKEIKRETGRGWRHLEKRVRKSRIICSKRNQEGRGKGRRIGGSAGEGWEKKANHLIGAALEGRIGGGGGGGRLPGPPRVADPIPLPTP